MWRRFICSTVVLLLVAGGTIQAEVFSDNFDTPHDYVADGVTGTEWTGMIGTGDDETVDALNASTDREGALYIESTGSYWEGAFSPMGPFLYRLVDGDFVATVRVTDFAGEAGNTVWHCDSFIMARVPDLLAAGAGEDFECVHYFPTWVGNMGRSYDNGSEDEWGSTGNGFNCATYLQLERVGDVFYHRYSFDGETWTELTGSPRTRPDMTGLPLQVGMAHAMYNALTGYVAFDDFTLEGPAIVSGLLKAIMPSPPSGATDVRPDITLSWQPGEEAITHDVYFGTDVNAVTEASRDNPLDVLVSQNQSDLTFAPGQLDFGQTYYWRVDEINDDNPGSPWKGSIWSFTVGRFVSIDDFESYNDEDNLIYDTWIDGWINGTGSTVGNISAPYAEQAIVHSGKQSMPYAYDNFTSPYYSEATRTWATGQDWTYAGVDTLVLWYYGNEENAAEQMYVGVEDGSGTITTVAHEDPAAAQLAGWQQWSLDLAAFVDGGADLTSVNSMLLGFGDRDTPTNGLGGIVYVDDIRLYLPAQVESVDPGVENLAAHYAFENNVTDSSGNGLDGTTFGGPGYVAGPVGYGNALSFDGNDDYVELPLGETIASMSDMTIATWANFSSGSGNWQRLWDLGTGTDNYMFLTPQIGSAGAMRFAITSADVAERSITAPSGLPSGWHHTAVTIDSATMAMKLYQDGQVVAEGVTPVLPSDLGVTTQNYLGHSQFEADDNYQGAMDEFRIYTRALSEAEILFLAGE